MKIYSRYKFKSGSKLVQGEKPNFFQFLLKNLNKDMVVLDLGCGSGELTIKLSDYCKKIIGLDSCCKYIKTAQADKKKSNIKNVFFKVGDAGTLPFKKNTFDLIYSSRGPLSAEPSFIKESRRVLKKGGILIEETIGETDKIELKRIFKRGQNFPYVSTRREFIRKLLSKCGIKLVYLKDFIYYQKFSSVNSLVKTLERTPIIPDFDRRQDKKSLEKIKLLSKNSDIIFKTHRLVWMGEK